MSDSDRDRVVAFTAERFPEVALEHCYSVRDDAGRRDVWVSRASNEAHLRSWARAAQLDVNAVRRIEASTPRDQARSPLADVPADCE